MIVGAVQHEAATGLDRSADMHVHVDWVEADIVGTIRLDAELLQQLVEADVGRALVDDEPHGSLSRMRAHVDDRASEALVGHYRHGDQELPLEIALAACLAFSNCPHRPRLTPDWGIRKGRAGLRSRAHRGVLYCL